MGQCFRYCGLADPCLTADEDEAAMPIQCGIEVLPQHAKFAVAPDEGGRGRTGHHRSL